MCALFIATAHATEVVDLTTVTDLAPEKDVGFEAHSAKAAAMATVEKQLKRAQADVERLTGELAAATAAQAPDVGEAAQEATGG